MSGLWFKGAEAVSHHVIPAPADYNAPAALARFLFQQDGPNGLNRARAVLTPPTPAILFHPPDPPIALQSITRDAPFSVGEHCPQPIKSIGLLCPRCASTSDLRSILPPFFNQHVFHALEESASQSFHGRALIPPQRFRLMRAYARQY